MTYKEFEFWNLNWVNEDTSLLIFFSIFAYLFYWKISIHFSYHILIVQCLHLYFTSLTVLKVPTSTWPRLLQGYYIFFYFFQQGVPQQEVPSRPLWNSTPVLTMKQCPEVEKPWAPFQKRAVFQTKPDQFREMETTRQAMDLSAMVEFCKVVEGGSHPKPIWW